MSRTLKFYYRLGNLTQDVEIVFTFPPPTKLTLSSSQNRVAWRIYKLEAKPDSSVTGEFTIDYPATLCFSIAQQQGASNVNYPGVAVEMKPGQSTSLIVSDSTCVWSEPTKIPGEQIEAVNKTNMFQDIYFGTVITEDGIDISSPTFMFKVGTENTAMVEFHPSLMMYHDIGYQGNGLITDGLKTNLIWEVNLPDLPETSSWLFAESTQGGYKVTRIDGATTSNEYAKENEDTVVTHPVPFYRLR